MGVAQPTVLFRGTTTCGGVNGNGTSQAMVLYRLAVGSLFTHATSSTDEGSCLQIANNFVRKRRHFRDKSRLIGGGKESRTGSGRDGYAEICDRLGMDTW